MNRPAELPAEVRGGDPTDDIDMTLSDWLAHIETTHSQVIDMGLARVATVKARLGLEPEFPVIVVGGTNGKGSTCAMLEAILRAAGYRVGCYTSPHLLRYNERVRLDGRQASDAMLCTSFAALEQARAATPLSYFEFSTLAAVDLFRRAEVDVAILEVGLGGRLDAVNAFDADCAVITSIDIDHVDYLGDTREAIGFEKAGIFRSNRPAVCADPDVPSTMQRHAAAIGADFTQLGRDFSYEADARHWRYRRNGDETLVLPFPRLHGDYQLANASAAIAALDGLSQRLPVTQASIHTGLVAARVAGRYQTLRREPTVILDVAHNPHAAAALARNLGPRHAAGRTTAVCAMLADKDIHGVIRQLRDCIDSWHVAGLQLPRGASAEILAHAVRAEIRGDDQLMTHDTPAQAYAAALAEASRSNDRVIVFGSFHTVAAVLGANPAC